MGTKVTISFPGIGIDAFTVDKIAFAIGNVEVRWYGIILTLGIVAGVLYAMYRAKYEGFKSDDGLDYALWTVLLAIVGARLYYVLTTLKDANGRWNYHSLLDVIAIWEGGIAIYGSIIGGAIALLLVSKFKKYKKQQVIKVFDMVAPGVMLGQVIGRWGNFVNGEAHGIPTPDTFFLRMGLSGAADINDKYTAVMTYYHPTFVYESLWNLLGFVLINLLYKKKKFDGQIVLMYLAWYGFGRMFIEGLRTDSLMIGVFRISQVIGFLCFVICTAALVYLLLRARRGNMDKEEYVSVYDKLHRRHVKAADTIQDAEQDDTNDTENTPVSEVAPDTDLVSEALSKEQE